MVLVDETSDLLTCVEAREALIGFAGMRVGASVLRNLRVDYKWSPVLKSSPWYCVEP